MVDLFVDAKAAVARTLAAITVTKTVSLTFFILTAAFTAPTMPLLARAKRLVGHKLNSAATVSEAAQNQICAYLSIALLVGLLANALLGWWWADPAAALVIAGLAGKEGWESWKGESCECC
jgi:divalent metal cation (Fe/Co/Zn/Cd) transporter